MVLIAACRGGVSKEPDLPQRPDRWVRSVRLDDDSKVEYIGTTKDYVITDVSDVRAVDGVRSLRLGDEISGVRVGAILCSFHFRDAEYGGTQYMWRGRWSCMAGRSRDEVEQAVADDGTKRFDYIHVAPVRLQDR